MPSWYDPATGLMTPQPASGSTVATFNGTIPAGTVRPIGDLVAFSRGDTVLLQHIGGTGLIRLCVRSVPPVYVNDPFEPPRYNAPADVLGQDGWLLIDDAFHVWAPNSLDTTLRVVADGTLAGGGLNSLQLAVVGTPARASAYNQPLLRSLPPALAYSARFDFYIDASAGGNHSMEMAPSLDGMAGLLQRPWIVTVYDDGTVIFTRGGGGLLCGPYLPGWHTFEARVTAANTIAAFIDGALVSGGADPLIGLLTATVFTNFANAAGAPVAGTGSVRIDNLIIDSQIPASGLNIPDGAGQELNANRVPLDLSQLCIGVAAGGADATIELLVIGA